MPNKQYQHYRINTSDLLRLIPEFHLYGPGIRYGVEYEAHLQQWLQIGAHCHGYVTMYGHVAVGLVAVYNDMSPDPHFPYERLAQVAFTVVCPGWADVLLPLYKFMQSELRNVEVQAVTISRQVSATEIRSKLHKL